MPTVKRMLILCLIFVAVFVWAQVNSGYTFPANGPCTPSLTSPGICNDNGTLIVYDTNGKKGPIAGPGIPGKDGISPTVDVGTTTTGAPGSSASVVNAGTTQNAKFQFTIPQGLKGDKGDMGLVVGSVFTVTQVCPKGQGTINAGWTTKDCVLAITAIK